MFSNKAGLYHINSAEHLRMVAPNCSDSKKQTNREHQQEEHMWPWAFSDMEVTGVFFPNSSSHFN